MTLLPVTHGPLPVTVRYLPRSLYAAGLLLLTAALFRPEAVITWLAPRATVILALDISGSMLADDVPPSRMEASHKAAKQFIAEQPPDVHIGIVAFAETAFLVHVPTSDRDSLGAAIDKLEAQPATAIGSGILHAINAVAPTFTIGDPDPDEPLPRLPNAVPPGSNKNAIIVLMTDGETTGGPDPVEAARLAADMGIRIYTIGFGTQAGSLVDVGGRYMSVNVDTETLSKIADITRGKFYQAVTGDELQAIYSGLTREFMRERGRTEITFLFCAAAALLMVMGCGLSVLWTGRIV